jgi:hypothetical protein
MNYTPIYFRFLSYGVFYWVKEIIDKQNSNTKNNEKWKNPAPNFWKLWTRNMIWIFIGLILQHILHKYHKLLKQHRYMFVEGLLQVVRFNVCSFQGMNFKEYNVQLFLQQA